MLEWTEDVNTFKVCRENYVNDLCDNPGQVGDDIFLSCAEDIKACRSEIVIAKSVISIHKY